MLVSCGVDHIGFPLRLHHHQEDISENEAAAIIREFPSTVEAVLITYLDKAEDVFQLSRLLHTRVVQLHGDISRSEFIQLKNGLPELQIIKSLIVGKTTEDKLIQDMYQYADLADAFLLDTYDPISDACGATGKVHDWGISRRVVELSPLPVILAGGLTPDNVSQAILTVKPAGVDVHSGVEDHNGFKDKQLVEIFIREARKAFQLLNCDR